MGRGCYLRVGGLVVGGRPHSCRFAVCLRLLLEGDGGGCSPPFVSPRCVLAFAVGGGGCRLCRLVPWYRCSMSSVVVSAGGSARRQAKMVERGGLIVVRSGA